MEPLNNLTTHLTTTQATNLAILIKRIRVKIMEHAVLTEMMISTTAFRIHLV